MGHGCAPVHFAAQRQVDISTVIFKNFMVGGVISRSDALSAGFVLAALFRVFNGQRNFLRTTVKICGTRPSFCRVHSAERRAYCGKCMVQPFHRLSYYAPRASFRTPTTDLCR